MVETISLLWNIILLCGEISALIFLVIILIGLVKVLIETIFEK